MFGNPFGEFQQDPFFDFGAASPFGNPRRHHQHALRFDSHAAGRPAQFPATVAPSPRTCSTSSAAISTGRSAATAATVGEWPPATSSALVPRGPSTGRGGGLALPGYSFGLPQFDRVFEGVERMMSDAGERMLAQEASQRPDFNGRVYSHASVYAYRSDGSGEPQVYQAVSESRAGPGGVRETRKALKDSRSREERIAVGTTSAAAGTRLRGGETPARASSRRTITMMALTRARASSLTANGTGVLLASPLKAAPAEAASETVALGTIGPSRTAGIESIKTVRHLLNLRSSGWIKYPLPA
ncbi:hypothetical protein BOX15_Mlig030875g1 [Macrostomum lignano]|uniref:Uncharacterized protein n=1 Tax=Macrostomum lignano TaxID=282301 RepID=A0A267FGB0_9PLAT|nr:hypothetical protein BOX15_Mlig030875g1 [Macrostomum lignano]